jgi:hypothetical protein
MREDDIFPEMLFAFHQITWRCIQEDKTLQGKWISGRSEKTMQRMLDKSM